MSRRVLIGKYNDGVTYGLRVSLPGVDVLTGDSSDATQFSFDSNWTDIAQLVAVGTISVPILASPGYVDAFFPSLGYYPFCEARRISGNVINDDYFKGVTGTSGVQGVPTEIMTDRLRFNMDIDSAYNAVYVVYNVAVPSP